jgi:membrane protein YdbS with pleckstrin-like domain
MSDLDQGRPHKPADDKEEIYFEGSPLLRGDLGRVFICAVIAAILVAIPILNERRHWFHMPSWGWIVAIALAIVCLLIPFIIIRAIRYRITNYRIDYERGILSKNIDTLELWHVEDINFHQSLIDRLVNTGDITIISHDDTTPKLELNGVPNPRPLFESLKQRVIAVKRQRGVIKMDTGG